MEPIKGITECDQSQEQPQLTRKAAIQWILEQVTRDRIGEIQFDVSQIDESPQHKTYDRSLSSNYVERLAHLFALSELEISKLDRDQLGYVFEVMLCIYLIYSLPPVQGNSSLRVLIVPEAVDSQSDVRQSDQRKNFDVLITEVTSDGNVKPIVGVSAKLKRLEDPSYYPDLRVPYVTITANQLWGKKTDQVLRDFLLRPQNYIQQLLDPQYTPKGYIAKYIFKQLMLYFKKKNINYVISQINDRARQSTHQNLLKDEVILLGLFRFATLFGFTELLGKRITSEDRKVEKTN